MLDAKISNISEWRAIISCINKFRDEATFFTYPGRITFGGLNKDHTSLLQVIFPKSSFKEYDSTSSQFTLKTCDLLSILNKCVNEQSLELHIAKKGRMVIGVNGPLHRQYVLKVFDDPGLFPPAPVIKPGVKAILSHTGISKILTDMNMISDLVCIKTKDDKITFTCEKGSLKSEIMLDKNSTELKSLDFKEPTETTYSLKYLSEFFNTIDAPDGVTLEYSDPYPLHLKFTTPSQVEINYHQAPYVIIYPKK